jgi:hypothetical protein
MGFPLLQKPGEMCVGRQIGVPGKFWNFNRDLMNEEEAATLFECTVRGFHSLHKWAGGGVPSQTMELQEMGVDGQVRTEPGGPLNYFPRDNFFSPFFFPPFLCV